MIMESCIENITQGIPELARNVTISIHLEGWPATVAVTSISVSVAAVLVYAIRKSIV